MKKIIIAFTGNHFSDGAFEFARRLNELQPILLTGVFVPQAELSTLWSYADGAGGLAIPIVEHNEAELIQQSVDRFEKLCLGNGIDYRIHKDFYDFTLDELKKESRYTDLLILGSEMFYKDLGVDTPNDYLESVLHNIQCPVILVPEKFDFPESNLLAYNGSENSVFAIKQFSYLFPELAGNPTLLVYATDKDKDFPDKIQIEELAARHFRDLTLYKMDVNPGKYFNAWLLGKKSALLVCGSYGRSGMSTLFKKSFIKDIISSHRLPVFIDHR